MVPHVTGLLSSATCDREGGVSHRCREGGVSHRCREGGVSHRCREGEGGESHISVGR